MSFTILARSQQDFDRFFAPATVAEMKAVGLRITHFNRATKEVELASDEDQAFLKELQDLTDAE